jgi:hypothetical protein
MSYSAEDVVLATARSLLFVREEPKNSNKGQAVEAFLKVTGLGGGYPWCAAYVAFCGQSAFGARWPLPLTAGCAALGQAADKKGILTATPHVGDVFLLYYPSLGRFAHTGFITAIVGASCRTIEGNTNDGGSRDGWGVFERMRSFGDRDRFIHWQDWRTP